VLRHLVVFKKEGLFHALAPLVNLKDDNDDFFASFLGIKMKTR